MRRVIISILVIAAVVLVVAVIGQKWFTRSSPEPAPAALGEVSSQTGQQVVATGIVMPVHWTRMSFSTSGKLDQLGIQVGDQVSTNQVLANLETQELEIAVSLAKNELAAQEANLAEIEKGASSAEVASAQAGYDAAVAAYEKLKMGPSADEIVIAQADLKIAEEALHRAQGAYDAVKNRPDIGARPESAQLQAATIDYERAKAAYNLAIAKPDQAALKQAESQVATAKARLDALPSDVYVAQISVNKAKLEVAQAELAMERATLRAPFAGTITTLSGKAGDLIDPGTAVLTLADLSELQIELTELDEWSAASIRLNQSVDLSVPALDNRILRGHLASIDSEPTISAVGAVFYKAIVVLEQQDSDLRWGMSVQCKFAKLTGGLR